RVRLEQRAGARPTVEQSADPDPRHQANSDLDGTRPMHTRQKRIVRPPRTKVGGGGGGITLIAREVVGRGEYRAVVVAGEFPDVSERALAVVAPNVDIEAKGLLWGPDATPWVEKPIRRGGHVVSARGEDRPVPGQQ